MNPSECTVAQRLVAELDDTRVVYARLGPMLIRPHLKLLVRRIVESHAAIAEDVAAQMSRNGGPRARRGGGGVARLRARVEGWIAASHVDVELGCLKRIISHEARVARRFRGTLAAVKDLHQSLQHEVLQIERNLFRVDSLIRELEMPPVDIRPRPAPVNSFSSNESSRR